MPPKRSITVATATVDGLLVGHVALDRERRMAGCFELRRGALRAFDVDVGDRDRRAFGRQRAAELAAHARRATGDERAAIREPADRRLGHHASPYA